MSKNLSVIDKRIASQLHKKQIEGTLLAERVAYNLDRVIDQTVDQVLRKIGPAIRGSLSDQNRNQAIGLLGQIGPKANESYLRDAIRIAHWSHSESVSILAKNIPRKWFRRIAPEAVMVGERIAIGPNVDPDTIKEPLWTRELTDAEWEELLKEVLFESPTEEQVLQVINQPIAGKETNERLSNLSGLIGNHQQVVDDLIKGLSSGENLQQITKRLEKQVQGVKSSARRIARTESLRVLDQMNRQTLEPLQDLMLGMQVLASLDQNTRPHHAHRHGTIYYNDHRRKPSIDELPDLPDEPNCRCWSSPVMNPPEGFENDPALRAEFANNDGDSIPDPGVYTQWFDKSDLSARKLAVGSRRYREMQRSLNTDREPEWTDFIDPDGKLLTVRQIQSEDDLDREKRKGLVQQSIDQRADLVNQVASRGFVDFKSPGKKVKKPSALKSVPKPVSKPKLKSKPKLQSAPKQLPILDQIEQNSELKRINQLLEKEFGSDTEASQRLALKITKLQEEVDRIALEFNKTKKRDKAKRQGLITLYTNADMELQKEKKEFHDLSAVTRKKLLNVISVSKQERMALGSVAANPNDPRHPTKKTKKKLTKGISGKANEATEFLSQITSSQVAGAEKIRIYELHKGGRAFQVGKKSSYGGIYMEASKKIDTYVHEIAHTIESSNPDILRKVVAFRDERIKESGTKDVHLNQVQELKKYGYRPGEIGNEDGFGKHFDVNRAHYCGKKYKNASGKDDGTEILSMGVQELYRDPAGFMANDPEYFSFIVGVLRGEL